MVKEGRERSPGCHGDCIVPSAPSFLFSSRLPSRENLPFSRRIDSSGFSNVNKKKKEKKKGRKKEGGRERGRKEKEREGNEVV